jgi:hypothetical protein
MAGMAHLGVGLAAKRAAPKTNVTILILAAYAIDLIWGIFYFVGIEHMSEDGAAGTNPWSHGLFMSLVWSLLVGGIAFWVSRKRNTGLIVGLLVFSHWVMDFISHPMKAVFPSDTGLPLLFENSPVVGLGVWSTRLGLNIGEYGTLALGIMVYIFTLWQLRREKRQHHVE